LAKRKLTENLVSIWPGLPYLAMGLWLAWAQITFGAAVWVSDVEINSVAPSGMWIRTTLSQALVILAASLLARKLPNLTGRRMVIAGGLAASLGSLLIILCGPYYFLYTSYSTYIGPISLVLMGVGMALIILKNMELYGKLPPRRAMLFVALSILESVLVYYFVVNAPDWTFVRGGPTIIATCAFVLMPILAALISTLPVLQDSISKRQLSESNKSLRELGSSFWKLVIACLVLALVESTLRSIAISNITPPMMLESNDLRMMMHLPLALILGLFAVQFEAGRLNMGKFYSIVVILLVITIALIPLSGGKGGGLSSLLSFLSDAFMILLWLLLAFASYQKRLQPTILFGLAYGAFCLGSAIGFIIGTGMRAQAAVQSNPVLFHLLLAGVVLILMFVLFSEKDLDRLFSPVADKDPSITDLLNASLKEDRQPVQERRFSKVITSIAEQYHLSKRETEVLRYLAMGRNSRLIAEKMFVSENTAKVHSRNVYTKLDVHSRQDLIDFVDHWDGR
jgi:DNA-binding CsgD family transcriptional regulator/MFS family permease